MSYLYLFIQALGPFHIIMLYIDVSIKFVVPCQCYQAVLIPFKLVVLILV